MPHYQTPPTAVAGFGLSSADWNAKVRDSMEALAKPVMCKCIRGAAWAASIPNSAVTPVVFDQTRWESDPTMWDAAQPTRITIPKAGRYDVRGAFYFSSSLAGTYRGIQIVRYNSLNVAQNTVVLDYRPVSAIPIINGAGDDDCAVGDYFVLNVQQDSGGTLGLFTTGLDGYCFLSVRLMHNA